MIIRPIKTDIVTASSSNIENLLDKYIRDLEDSSIVAVSSKIVALCEGRVAPLSEDREKLLREESQYYLPAEQSKYGHHFTVVGNTILGSAGVDLSNADNQYVLWPKDPQASANAIRKYLRVKFDLVNVGVIITDSVSIPMRLGAVGAAIAYSGFRAIKDYIGKPDLFGREFKVERANIATGLAAAAVTAMGEGAEQTPLAVVTEIPSIEFCHEDPSPEELAAVNLSLEDDLFEPFFKNAPWEKGGANY